MRLKSAKTRIKQVARSRRRPALGVQRSEAGGLRDSLLQLQRTHGNRVVQGLLASRLIQAKLNVSRPGDESEQEADRVADHIVRMSASDVSEETAIAGQDRTATVQRTCSDEEAHRLPMEKEAGTPGVDREWPSNIEEKVSAVRGGGQPLSESARAFFEPRFGHDFSQVRTHTDVRAAETARALHARAFTIGTDIAFGSGQYDPESFEGRRLLGHELTHVVQQQAGECPEIRREARLSDYEDKKPEHDPSKLTDAEIEATGEYKAYIDPKTIWQTKHKMTKAEARLACRLMLRFMRDGNFMVWISDGEVFMNRARSQLGTLSKAEATKGKLEWVPFNTTGAVADPSKLQSDFARWLLAGDKEPDATTGKVNCWEMVMFSAFKGGFISKKRMEDIYTEAVKQVKAGNRTFVGDTIEVELRGSNEQVLDTTNPKSPEPLPGDIVIFSTAKNHVAISLGTKDGTGKHKIISHWPPPDGDHKTKQTTIEELLASMDPGQTVKFWSAKW